ncbi:MAG: gliding motility-associated C-terminal domain-containing protein [Muribaculaceae bacterium]|nr:gliding motility-associated C-terminal domain-containing protein [Muribaculaceae bacterium]
MLKHCLTLGIIFFVSLTAKSAIDIDGTRYVDLTPAASTGLEKVFVVEDGQVASITYTAQSVQASSSVKWYKFSALGGGYAEPVADVEYVNNKTTVRGLSSDIGYIVEDGGRQIAFWVVNYANHHPTLTSLTISANSECDRVTFNTTGSFDRIVYYSVNGAPTEVDRDITLTYNDLEFHSIDDADGYWTVYEHQVHFPYITNAVSTQAPLCNTAFKLSGDMFLKAWGEPVEIETSEYITSRVEAVTSAQQLLRDNDNEQQDANSGLGGSAPCDITFSAIPTDAALFREWQFSETEDFIDVLYRFNEDVFTYTFTEAGTTYVKYVCADAIGNCTFEGDVYTVSIGESKLLCPNAFSPHNEDGVNDLWKVSYSSLISYECHIFNRWGKELFSSTNPAEGWDGRIGGKFVPSGVYFYVIKAEGADGKKYSLKGDINIVGSKLKPTTGAEE